MCSVFSELDGLVSCQFADRCFMSTAAVRVGGLLSSRRRVFASAERFAQISCRLTRILRPGTSKRVRAHARCVTAIRTSLTRCYGDAPGNLRGLVLASGFWGLVHRGCVVCDVSAQFNGHRVALQATTQRPLTRAGTSHLTHTL